MSNLAFFSWVVFFWFGIGIIVGYCFGEATREMNRDRGQDEAD